MNLIFLLSIIFIFIILSKFKKETFTDSDNHVNYPFDAYPDETGEKINKFLVKLPYDNLTTRHYKKMYHNKTTPKCVINGKCPNTPGYFKTYPDYFENPSLLKSFYLGYSINGYPYNDMKFPKEPSKESFDVKEPNHRFDYPSWFDYDKPRKEAKYIGFPFYFGGKKMF